MYKAPELEEATRLLTAVMEVYPHLLDLHRVLHDVVYGADGNLEKLRKLAKLAQSDYRDLIMATEYELVNGKIVKKEGFPLFEKS